MADHNVGYKATVFASVTQCNLQKSKMAQIGIGNDIRQLNKKNKPFIFLVQEPCLNNNNLALQPLSCKKYSVGIKPRTCIYTSMGRENWLVESLSTRDLIVIQTEIKKQKVLIASSYLDIENKDVLTVELTNLMEYAARKNWGLLIGMDSNCHSVTFGLETNARGEILEEFMATHNLTVENIGKEPTYESRGNTTCIDVTLTRNLNFSILQWMVNREFNSSDHNSIHYDLEDDLTTLPKTWKYHNADWALFNELLTKQVFKLPNNINQEDLEKAISDLYKKLHLTMKKSVPRSKPKTIDKNNPWWTKKLKTERNSVSKLYKLYINNKTEANLNNYKAKNQIYKRNCEKARKRSWLDLQSNINDIQSANNFRKIIEGGNKATLGTLVKDDGTITDPGTDTLDHLLDKHFPSAEPIRQTVYSNQSITLRKLDAWDPDWITEEKIIAIFHSFQNKKSPGTDELSPIVLKHLPRNVIAHLTRIYKACIKLNFTPTKWKECRLVFIPKPGKVTYKIAKAWRPISLTNYLLKALEKLGCWHMDSKIAVKPLHIRQHGFRHDRNTDTSISNVVNYIEKHIYTGQHAIGVFLDIQAAFDTISPEKIKTELLKYGADEDMAKWYYNYITHRNMHLTINGVTKKITTSMGFPQGGVCSAKFWIIAFNEAIEIINTLGVYGNGFADDCVALIGGKNLHQMMSRMQKVVIRLEEWGLTHGLQFNASKTEVIIFTLARPKKKDLPNKLKVGNLDINFGKEAKYLGVTLDHKLLWTPHVDKTTNKNKQYLFMLRAAVSKKWGPSPTYMKWIFNTIIKPRITYACLVWGPSLRHKTKENQIRSINKLAVSMISCTRRSTPRIALEVIYNLPPLHLVITYEALASISRNNQALIRDWEGHIPGKTSLKGHLYYWAKKAEKMNIDITDTDKCNLHCWEKKFTVNEDSFNSTSYPIQGQINIYTDGSKTDEHVGSGYVIYKHEREIESNSTRLSTDITVFQAEVLAIKLAVSNYLCNKSINDRYIKIFSDSQAAIQALNKWKIKSHLVAETIWALNRLGEKCFRLEINWIKAHNNYKGNERADELARQAVQLDDIYTGLNPPASTLKRNLWNAIYNLWDKEWKADSTCRMTKLFFPYIHKGKSKLIIRLSRQKSRRLIEIVTGQNNLHYIQNKIKKEEHLCRFCEEEDETFDHLITSCPCFYQSRLDIMGQHNPTINHRWTIKKLLDFSYIKNINMALKHPNDSDISGDETDDSL